MHGPSFYLWLDDRYSIWDRGAADQSCDWILRKLEVVSTIRLPCCEQPLTVTTDKVDLVPGRIPSYIVLMFFDRVCCGHFRGLSGKTGAFQCTHGRVPRCRLTQLP